MTQQTADIAQTTLTNHVNIVKPKIESLNQGGAFERLFVRFGQVQIGMTICLN